MEDDVFLGDVLVQKLKNEDFEVVLARDGLEGFDKIKTFQPDLILLDIILPNMNGYEILEAKHKDISIESIPVIIISNSGQPVEINRALALGVKDYLVKAQFDPEEVLVKVRAQFRGEDSKKELDKLLNNELNTSSNQHSLLGKKVVLVEDDKFLTDIISKKLSMTKCTFFHAGDGVQAIDLILKEIPDIIMLDVVLPNMDGFEILRKIKADPKIKHIPVILLSNLGQENDIKKGHDLGADKFLVKATVTPDEIIDEINIILGRNM
jgi:DNA-binding response OmpR family regulator